MSLQNAFEAEFSKPSVFSDRNKIMPHYTPEVMPFREKQLGDITRVVAAALRGQRPENLFIYGKPGTGKTSSARHVMDELSTFAGKKELKIRHVYINCRTHNKKYKVLLKCLRELFPSEPDKAFQGYSAAYLYEKLVSFVRDSETHLLLVLDELDKVRDLDELIYSTSRSNELPKGDFGDWNFQQRFSKTHWIAHKSSLCQRNDFSPYSANSCAPSLNNVYKHSSQRGGFGAIHSHRLSRRRKAGMRAPRLNSCSAPENRGRATCANRHGRAREAARSSLSRK